jgi:hypothetical protein
LIITCPSIYFEKGLDSQGGCGIWAGKNRRKIAALVLSPQFRGVHLAAAHLSPPNWPCMPQ